MFCSHCAEFDWDYLIRGYASQSNQNEFNVLENNAIRSRSSMSVQIPKSDWNYGRLSSRFRFQIGNYIVSQSLWDGNEFVLKTNRTIRFFAPPLEAILNPLRKCRFCGFVAALFTSQLDAQTLEQLQKSEHTVLCTSVPGPYSRILMVKVLREIATPEDILRHQFHASLARIDFTMADTTLGTSRVVRDTKQLDRNVLKLWYNRCQSHQNCHELHVNRGVYHDIPGFKVIDVLARRVIAAPSNCSYVALSYVWGGEEFYRARKQDFVEEESDLRSGSQQRSVYLYLFQSRVPQTIEDAMAVVKLIGEQYLW